MRRELLKDEAVGKIADDKKKQAFLKSIEDRDEVEDEEMGFQEEEVVEEDSQSQSQTAEDIGNPTKPPTLGNQQSRKRPLEPSAADITNRPPPNLRRTVTKSALPVSRKPSTLAEIREQVSFLVEEPDSQNGTPDPASDDETEAYVNLDRHLHQAEADEENAEVDQGLADFIVDDERPVVPAFKKPDIPPRAPANERRTKPNVVDRLSLLRQASSSSSSSGVSASSSSTGRTSKLAFFSSFSSTAHNSSTKMPSLLRRATTNSSFSSEIAGSAAVSGTERGAVENEKEVIRKAQGGRRSAINYYAQGRMEQREEKMGRISTTCGRVEKKMGLAAKKTKGKGKGGLLGELFGGGIGRFE